MMQTESTVFAEKWSTYLDRARHTIVNHEDCFVKHKHNEEGQSNHEMLMDIVFEKTSNSSFLFSLCVKNEFSGLD